MFEECEIDTYPIDSFLIAARLRYVIRTYESLTSDEFDEAFSISSDAFSRVEMNPDTGMYEYVIYYNEDIGNSQRIRWSIFHEIGHIYLGHHDHPDDRLYTEEEAEANFFARYASAPCPLVHVADCKSDFDVEEKFDLSYSASHWAFVSYKNWLHYGPRDYRPYELNLLKMFHLRAA